MTRDDFLMIATAMAIGLGAVAASASPQGGMHRPDFTELDVDGSGEITAEDLSAVGNARFAEIDADGNGSVSRDEFSAAAAARASDRAGEMFDRLDADGDGQLSRDVLESRGRGLLSERMIDRLDADDSGGISEDEFDAAFERMAGRRGDGRGFGFGRHSR